MRPDPSLCIFAGPSGGHLFPALAFAESFRERFPQSRLYLVTSRKAEAFVEKMPPGIFDGVDYLNNFPFPAGLSLRTVRFFLEFVRAFGLSAGILNRRRPDLCVGFGSYVSYPGMMLAVWKKIPTLIHEQNKVPGKATRMLARHVDLVALSFEGSFQASQVRKLTVTGLPVRRALRDRVRDFTPKALRPASEGFHLLVTGGSQGSHRLNELVLESFSRLSPEETKKLAVTHITGKADFDFVREAYRKSGIRGEILAFSNHMDDLYSTIDAAITRAGANTVTELALFGVPAVLVPYPHADGHQEDNARYLVERGAACAHPEKTLTADWLAGKIREFQENGESRRRMAAALAGIARKDAGGELVNAASGLLGE